MNNGSGGGNYPSGAVVNISANTSPAGKQFKNWTSSGGGTIGSATASATTFTMPSNAVTVTANYEDKPVTTYTLSLSSNNTGWGTVSGGGTYNEGASVTVTATAKNGYRFVNWKGGNSVVSTSASYTFTMNGNRTLTANFEAIPPTPATIK